MATTYESVSDLARVLERAAAAHGQHEENRRADPDSPEWDAPYMVRERASEELAT